MRVLISCIVSLFLLSSVMADDPEDNKKLYTVDDFIYGLTKLANDTIARQRFPPPPNYEDYQKPYKKKRPYKKKPYSQRPGFDYADQAGPVNPYFQDPQRPGGSYVERPYFDGRPDPYLQDSQRPDGSYVERPYFDGRPDPYLQRPEGFYGPEGPYPQGGSFPYPPGGPYDPSFGPYPDFGPFSSLGQALFSIAKHDDQQCVPRLLCEVAAGGNPNYYRQSSSFLPSLPSILNMDSLFTLVSAFTGEQVSPFLVFGRAALLGATSRGNPSSCRYAYPECPRDPDRLVDYLNNHNGGFFRFFNGLSPPGQNPVNFPQEQYPQQQQYLQQQQQYLQQQQQQQYYQGQSNRPYRPNRYRQRTKENSTIEAEARIQNKQIYSNHHDSNVELYIAQSYFHPKIVKGDGAWKFPEETRTHIHTNAVYDHATNNDEFKFPSDSGRKRPKSLKFTNENDEIFYPTPLPYYDHSKMIFPDRTGTGNLKFDADKLLQSSYNNQYYYRDQIPNYSHYQQSQKQYVYVVKDDPNNPELIELRRRHLLEEQESLKDGRTRRGIPWTFPSPYQGVIYNDRSFDINQ